MKNIIKKSVLLPLFMLLLVGLFFWKELYVNAFLFFIPKEEKKQLEYAFFFLNDAGFPWVAQGIKPLVTFDQLTYIEYILEDPTLDPATRWSEIFAYLYPINTRISAGLKIWKKYAHFFPSKTLKIVETSPSFFYHYWGCRTVMILNVATLKKIITQNYAAFVSILGDSFNTDSFINMLIRNPGDFETILKGNHYLMGILYGFGEENALLFQIRAEPYSFCVPPYLITYQSNRHRNDLNHLRRFLDKYRPEDPQNLSLNIPGFITNPHSKETLELEKTYLENFQKINKEMKKTSLLKWNLYQLMSH